MLFFDLFFIGIIHFININFIIRFFISYNNFFISIIFVIITLRVVFLFFFYFNYISLFVRLFRRGNFNIFVSTRFIYLIVCWYLIFDKKCMSTMYIQTGRTQHYNLIQNFVPFKFIFIFPTYLKNKNNSVIWFIYDSMN